MRPSVARVVSVLAALWASAYSAMPVFGAGVGPRDALDGTRLGLYDGAQFRLVDGRCIDCPTIPQALWYFRDEVIAVPRSAEAGFTRERTVQDDVKEWVRAHPGGDAGKPPLVWIGSPQLADGAQFLDAGQALIDGRTYPLSLARKIDSNRSYFDASSARHFQGRRLTLRGKTDAGRFIVRTIWPRDYDLGLEGLPYRPLQAGESLVGLVRADAGGARLPLSARVLWQRDPGAKRDWARKPVLAVMLNGAQGDDDEAHGGHFAIATGAFGPAGEWGDWLINNFYNLDSVSEKGIIAATLPMDAYLADLNSGQSWYRPSYMLVTVLKQDRAATLFQQAVGRVYNHFYRHDFQYRHSIENCAGISMQTLRALGWGIPKEGPTSRLKAIAALPLLAVTDRSLESGRQAYDYLVAEQTDLYPFAAFDAAGRDLLGRIAAGRAGHSPYEELLGEDLEAVIFVRIPQFPSSREFGQAPVLSIDEYRARVPKDKSQWKIIPVPARPFPAELKDRDVPADRRLPSEYALYAYAAFIILCGIGVWRFRRRLLPSRYGRPPE